VSAAPSPREEGGDGTGSASPLARLENAVAVFLLSAMALLPLLEMAGRHLWRTGIPASSALVQHATLWVGLLGGAISARGGRLMSLGRGAERLPGRLRDGAMVLSHGFSSAVCAALAWASYLMVRADVGGGEELVPHVPLWIAQLALPAGYAVLSWRMAKGASASLPGRLAAAAVAAAMTAVLLSDLLLAPGAFAASLLLVLLAVILGAPLFAGLGAVALVLFLHEGVTIASIPVEIYRRVTAPTLPTIPLFAFAGYLLTAGDASRRLVRFFRAMVGWMPGAIAVVTILACTFFTTFTGASGVTILALGGMLLPVLVSEGYPERFSLGLVTATGSLGLLFPPCLPVILYAVIAGIPVDRMFLGGLLPGTLLVAVMLAVAVRSGILSGAKRIPFSRAELAAAVWEAKWDLLLPLIVLVGIFGGFATMVEAAALSVLYAFFAEFILHRGGSVRKRFPRIGAEAATLVGGVLLVLASATGLTGYMVDAGVPSAALEWVRETIHSKLVFLLALNAFLLLVGCLMDIFSAIVVVVPVIAPMAEAYGINPVHLGIVFLANLEVGFLNPPVGLNLFLSAYRFDRSMGQVIRAVLPFYLILLAGVLAITYVPALTEALLP
jgi:tripartite ATP-independent transporter DctM subunit